MRALGIQPLSRPPTQKHPWIENPLDRDPSLDRDPPHLDRDPCPGQRPPLLDRDPSWTETPLDIDPPVDGQTPVKTTFANFVSGR